jgi:hypothetical protein
LPARLLLLQNADQVITMLARFRDLLASASRRLGKGVGNKGVIIWLAHQ